MQRNIVMRYGWAAMAMAAMLAAGGCRDKEPANVFPHTKWYDRRTATMEISPEQAFRLAYEAATHTGRQQYVSRRPQVIYGREYVFSIPTAQGANLKGYHVNGDTGSVRFYKEDRILKP